MTDKKKSIVERFAERASSETAARSHPGIVGGPPSSAMAPRVGPANGNASHRDFGSGAQSLNMANIDLQALGRSGYVVPGAGRSKIVEEMRAIKRPLLLNAFEPSHPATGRDHVIMVTSTQPNEGKTFVATNLAMSIASEKGLNVLLVDADVVRRDIPTRLGFHAEYGFLDLLQNNDLSIQDVLVRTNVPNLTVLPSGDHVAEATELLSSPQMKSLMSDLATRYSDRVIIIDTPPVLMSSEAGVLASHVGQVVMVVEANETSERDVSQALSLISSCNNISLILNKVTDQMANERYGAYSYYYQAGQENG
jgi:receptor protein-tyrosine kinase